MVKVKKIISEKDEIWRDDNENVVRLRVKVEGYDFDEKDIQRQFDTYTELGINEKNKSRVLIEAAFDFNMNREARELASKQSKHFFKACAIVSESLSTRLIVNFLNSFYIFDLPIKMFTNEAEALTWLAEFL